MITSERARALLSYEPLTGLFNWKSTGASTGCLRHDGYLMIGVDNQVYLAHRLAWLMMTGEWPKTSVDHINRKKDDNAWANLRLATAQQNTANTLARQNSKTGIKGVSFCASTSKWRATITIDGKQRSLGRHADIECARLAYQQAAKNAFGRYATD